MIFNPPIQFPVFVEGRRLTAFVQEEIEHPVKTIFRISFSDGFADDFSVEDDGRVYGAILSATPYARAILFDVVQLVGLNPNKFYYNFLETVDGNPANVWVLEGENSAGETIYKVYWLEFFRFALKRGDAEWFVSDKPKMGKELDEAIIRKTGFLLDALLDEEQLNKKREV